MLGELFFPLATSWARGHEMPTNIDSRWWAQEMAPLACKKNGSATLGRFHRDAKKITAFHQNGPRNRETQGSSAVSLEKYRNLANWNGV